MTLPTSKFVRRGLSSVLKHNSCFLSIYQCWRIYHCQVCQSLFLGLALVFYCYICRITEINWQCKNGTLKNNLLVWLLLVAPLRWAAPLLSYQRWSRDSNSRWRWVQYGMTFFCEMGSGQRGIRQRSHRSTGDCWREISDSSITLIFMVLDRSRFVAAVATTKTKGGECTSAFTLI